MQPTQQQLSQFAETMRIQEQVTIARALKGAIISAMLITEPTQGFLTEIEIQARTLLTWVLGSRPNLGIPPDEQPS